MKYQSGSSEWGNTEEDGKHEKKNLHLQNKWKELHGLRGKSVKGYMVIVHGKITQEIRRNVLFFLSHNRNKEILSEIVV